MEEGDHDCVLAWDHDGTQRFTPVQLKELPPADLNASITIADLLAGVTKKYAKTDTVLVVHLNRRGSVPLADLVLAESPFKEAWFLWCSSDDQDCWCIWGESLAETGPVEFRYPTK